VHADVGTQPGYVGGAVVETEPESWSQLDEPGSAQIAASSSPTHGRTSALPPTRPDSGEATMLRTCYGWPTATARFGEHGDDRPRVGDRAQLHVGAAGQLQRS